MTFDPFNRYSHSTCLWNKHCCDTNASQDILDKYIQLYDPLKKDNIYIRKSPSVSTKFPRNLHVYQNTDSMRSQDMSRISPWLRSCVQHLPGSIPPCVQNIHMSAPTCDKISPGVYQLNKQSRDWRPRWAVTHKRERWANLQWLLVIGPDYLPLTTNHWVWGSWLTTSWSMQTAAQEVCVQNHSRDLLRLGN